MSAFCMVRQKAGPGGELPLLPNPEETNAVGCVHSCYRPVVSGNGIGPSPLTAFERIFRGMPLISRMRYIRQYNKNAKPAKWKHFDSSRRITPDSIVTVH